MRVVREEGGREVGREVDDGARARGVLLLKRLLELSQDLCKHTNVSPSLLLSPRLVSSANPHSCARARSFVLSLCPSLSLSYCTLLASLTPRRQLEFFLHTHTDTDTTIQTHTHTDAHTHMRNTRKHLCSKARCL